MALTNLQQEFINQYFQCGRNATEAVIRAGYKTKDRNVAANIGSDNLRKPKIREEIDRRLTEYAMPANEVIALLSDHARTNIGDYFDLSKSGFPKLNLNKAEERGVLHCVSKIKITQSEHGPSVEIEFHSAQAAAVHLGKYYGLFKERVEIVDWREEVREHGIDDASLFNQLVATIANQSSGD